MAMPLPLLHRPRLALEISVVLAIKILLLWFIWATWFSQPVARHMQLPPNEVARQLLAAPPARATTTATANSPSIQPSGGAREE